MKLTGNNFLLLPFSSSFELDFILLIITGLLITISCLKLIWTEDLLESVIILSILSLLLGICYLLLDAPDVAMTETALGAALSTCVLLNLLRIFKQESSAPSRTRILLASLLCLILTAALVFASLDLPRFGNYDSPLHRHVSKYYIDNNWNDIAIPSIVASILADYRGFDTLGETSVILIAGLGVVVILSGRKRDA